MALRIQSTLPIIKSPNYFEKDFGKPEPDKLAKMEKILREFMRDIRALYDTTCSTLPYCSTCALEPETDSWQGFVPTAYAFMHAIATGRKFVCHSNQSQELQNKNLVDTTRNIQRCRGFQRIMENERARAIQIATQAMAKIRQVA